MSRFIPSCKVRVRDMYDFCRACVFCSTRKPWRCFRRSCFDGDGFECEPGAVRLRRFRRYKKLEGRVLREG